MGVSIPQVVSEDRASGGQVSDSSLIFSNLGTAFGAGSYLTRTPSSTGNTRQWTWSAWVKRGGLHTSGNNIFAAYVDDNNRDTIRFGGLSADCYEYQNYDGGNGYGNRTNSVYRDTAGWYHVVIVYDSTLGSDRVKYYVNGTQITWLTNQGSGAVTSEQKSHINTTGAHYIGARKDSSGVEGNFDGMISQAYFIDGQALEATEFGYTDPLTNTWRLKKFIAPYKPNKGQDWAGMCAGGTDSGYGHEKAFDGSDATNCYPSPGSTVTMTIPAGKLKYTTSFEAWVSRDINGGVITVNGGSDVSPSGSGFQIVDLSGQVAAGADITEITWARAGAGSIGIAMIYIMIDGVALMDDDLTNMGVNGFYLPMDGNSPAGQDTSGRGNDWTLVSMGGFTPLDKATGALPILNIVNGGNASSPGVRTDTFGNSCVLALPLVDIVTDVSNQINSGSTTKTMTVNGDTTASTTESSFYGGSYYFDGTGDWLVNNSSSSDFSFGTGDFTIECWAYWTGSSEEGLFQLSTNADGYNASNTNTVSLRVDSNTWVSYANDGNRTWSSKVATDTWYHVAIVRDSGTLKLFVNGVQDATTFSDSRDYSMTYCGISGNYSSTYLWTGYIQDFRVYKGAAKYTNDFIVGSSSPDIVQDTPAGVSQSSQLTKVTDGGAVSFDGTGDKLTVSDSGTDFQFGTGDFTVEAFVYYNATPSSCRYIIDMRSSGVTDDTGALAVGYSGDNTKLQWAEVDAQAIVEATWANYFGTNSWNHIAVARSGSTTKMFINGEEVDSATDTLNYADPADITIGDRYTNSNSSQDFDGFISNVRIVKGTALYTANFTPPTAPLTNVTNTKLLCCQSNTSATEGAVKPGTITASGNAAATNFNPFNTDIDTVLGRPSGYAVMNTVANSGDVNLSDGNLTIDEDASGEYHNVTSTLGMSSGKFYCEYRHTLSATGNGLIGIAPGSFMQGAYAGSSMGSDSNTTNAYGFYTYNRGVLHENSYNMNGVASNVHSRVPQGSIIGIALDMDNYKCWWSVDGIWQTYPSSGVDNPDPVTGAEPHASGFDSDSDTWYFCWTKAGAETGHFNFGQQPFRYTPPDGYEPLCLANTQRPGNARPDQYMRPITWTGEKSGSGGLTRQISTNNLLNGPFAETPILFQPDLVWIKQRNQAYSTGWQIYDSVRGAGAEKEINCSSTAIEGAGNIEAYGWLESFDKNGFTVKGGSTDYDYVDKSGVNYVAYGWKAGGNSNTFNIDDVGYSSALFAGLAGGDISPTGCSINTKTGFSILKYTGNQGTAQTLNHGLGEIPDFVVCKNLGTTYNWFIWHEAFGNGADAAIYFTNAAKTTGYVTQPFGTFTTSSLTFNYNDGVNGAYDYICYAWKNVPGVQKFGKYAANNSTNGPYVELGFKPALVCIKSMTTGGTARNWAVVDSTRSYANVANHTLAWNLNNAEADFGGGDNVFGAANMIDLLSNGFKIRDTGNWCNESGATYIYMAWAESPFHNLYGGQANAR